MSSCVPSILILGHSFVRRLRDDLDAHFDTRAASNFHLPESGYITLLGTGGRTVEKVVKYDLQSVHKYKPDIVILELGTNDLSTHAPEVVGSKIDDLVHALRHTYNVRVVGVCQPTTKLTSRSLFTDVQTYAQCSMAGDVCQNSITHLAMIT